jgi:hypothetical protein
MMMEIKMKSILIGSFFAGVAVAGLFLVVLNAVSMPDVMVSYSSGECVEVVNYSDDNFSCDNLPSRYNHVWVK